MKSRDKRKAAVGIPLGAALLGTAVVLAMRHLIPVGAFAILFFSGYLIYLCRLRDVPVATIAENALRHFDRDRYELLAWCVMPNHVQVLVDVRLTPLWKMVQSWKVHIENQARKLFLSERRAPPRPGSDSSPNLPRQCSALRWQREYWDTFMRDETQQHKAVHYTENNPVKATLCRTDKDWPCSSARWRDEYGRLIA